MDPHANIYQQREVAGGIISMLDSGGTDGSGGNYEMFDIEDIARTLAELVLALDQWRLKGGYDPYAPPGG